MFHVKDFGAIGDGQQLDTIAIAAAIQACADAGGGRVTFSTGIYLTGPIELRSDVELHLSAGATVRFSRNYDDYPLVVTHYEGQETVTCRSPIWGENLRNVSITGRGT